MDHVLVRHISTAQPIRRGERMQTPSAQQQSPDTAELISAKTTPPEVSVAQWYAPDERAVKRLFLRQSAVAEERAHAGAFVIPSKENTQAQYQVNTPISSPTNGNVMNDNASSPVGDVQISIQNATNEDVSESATDYAQPIHPQPSAKRFSPPPAAELSTQNSILLLADGSSQSFSEDVTMPLMTQVPYSGFTISQQ
jgi:hypothetical protein